MRRFLVEKYYLELLKLPEMPEYILKCLIAAHGPWVHVDRFGYQWRLNSGAVHHKLSAMTVNAARWRVIPVHQKEL
jgi:hypothetical protein